MVGYLDLDWRMTSCRRGALQARPCSSKPYLQCLRLDVLVTLSQVMDSAYLEVASEQFD